MSPPRRVSLIRNPYQPRDGSAEEALTGLMRLRCEVSTEPPSFLHIGSGSLVFAAKPGELGASMSFDEAVSAVRRRPQLARYEYMGLVRYGGVPCIPGSSLKGTCRARIELLTRAADNTVPVGFRQATPPPASRPAKGTHGWRHFRIWEPATWEDRGPDCDATKGGSVCAACDIFGAPGLSSRVFFGNLAAERGAQVYELELDYGERVEAVGPGAVFRGEASFSWLRPFELGLVLIGLGAKEDGSFAKILLGKSKYRERRIVRASPGTWRGLSLAGAKARFGVVEFSLEEVRLVRGMTRCEALPSCGVEEGPYIAYRGDCLKELVKWLVGEARKKVPGINVGFSEAAALASIQG